MAKAQKFKGEKTEHLQKVLADKREALRVFRFEGAGSRRRNVKEGRELRRDIARILTEMSAQKVASKGKSA